MTFGHLLSFRFPSIRIQRLQIHSAICRDDAAAPNIVIGSSLALICYDELLDVAMVDLVFAETKDCPRWGTLSCTATEIPMSEVGCCVNELLL